MIIVERRGILISLLVFPIDTFENFYKKEENTKCNYILKVSLYMYRIHMSSYSKLLHLSISSLVKVKKSLLGTKKVSKRRGLL